MSDALVIPGTGEIVEPDDPAAVARALDGLGALQRQLGDVRRHLIELLVEEAQRQGTKTLHVQGGKVTLTGGTRTRWDLDKLNELEQAGLPAERLNAFLRPKVTWSPDGNVARQLRGANEEYRRIIDEARITEPAPWGCKVELARAVGHEHALPAASEGE